MMRKNEWAVFRQDFSGNEFLVEKNLSKERANELVLEYESHKHHQHYWACKFPVETTNFTAILEDLLKSGSPIQTSLQVLKNQHATFSDCCGALKEVKNISFQDAQQIVMNSNVFSS